MRVHSLFSPLAKQVIRNSPVTQNRFVTQVASHGGSLVTQNHFTTQVDSRNLFVAQRRFTTTQTAHRSSAVTETASGFDFKGELHKLCVEFADIAGLPKRDPLSNIALCSVQHLLGTTGDMFEEMRQQGLGAKKGMPLVMTGKVYSTHAGTMARLQKMGFTVVPSDEEQLTLGGYDQVNSYVLGETWREFDGQLKEFFIARLRENLSEVLPKGASRELVLALSDPELLSYYKSSVIEEVKRKFREKHMPTLFSLDDGFKLTPDVRSGYFNGLPQRPCDVVAAEQTTAGTLNKVFKMLRFRIVNVAGSFLKAWELPGVAEEVATQVVRHTQSLMVTLKKDRGVDKARIGIIGFGAVGQRLVEFYERQGHAVQVYDVSLEKKKELEDRGLCASSLYTLIRKSDIVVSCTPTDITEDVDLREFILNLPGTRIYCSASSGIESYKELLFALNSRMAKSDPIPKQLDEIVYEDGDTIIRLPRGTTPINFSNQEHSVQPREIFATRALLTAAMFMAARMHTMPDTDPKVYMVCPLMQYAILLAASKINPENPLIEKISAAVPNWNTPQGKVAAVEYIAKHSGGERFSYEGKAEEKEESIGSSAVSLFRKLRSGATSTDSTSENYSGIAYAAAPASTP